MFTTRNPYAFAVMILLSLLILAAALLGLVPLHPRLILAGVSGVLAMVAFSKHLRRRLILGIRGNVYSEGNYLDDVVLDEEDDFRESRDEVTVLSGQKLAIGTVLGKLTSGGQVTAITPGTSDGAQHAYGVLVSPGGIDASATGTNADTPGVAITRLAILKDSGLVWPAGISDNDKATAIAELLANHVQIRKAIDGTAAALDATTTTAAPTTTTAAPTTTT
jgi:Bacteriophage lambda head decoration protein D